MKNLCFQLNRKLWVTMAMLLTFALPSLAQKITVSGHVADEHGEDLIGATVMEKGTTNGTSADLDGNFTITVPQIVVGLTGGLIVKYLFGGQPLAMIALAGVFMLLAAVSVGFVREK